MTNVPNDNILKLRVLSEKISQSDSNQYKTIVRQMKTIVENGKHELENEISDKDKVACYETMCVSIMNLLKNVRV